MDAFVTCHLLIVTCVVIVICYLSIMLFKRGKGEEDLL